MIFGERRPDQIVALLDWEMSTLAIRWRIWATP